MKNKKSSTEIEGISLPQSQEISAEIAQMFAAIKVTTATVVMSQSIEIAQPNSLNRKEAAQTLRVIAQRLMAGTLGVVLTVSLGSSWQFDNDDGFSLEQHESAKIL